MFWGLNPEGKPRLIPELTSVYDSINGKNEMVWYRMTSIFSINDNRMTSFLPTRGLTNL